MDLKTYNRLQGLREIAKKTIRSNKVFAEYCLRHARAIENTCDHLAPDNTSAITTYPDGYIDCRICYRGQGWDMEKIKQSGR
jgi:hypothetical protein